MSEDKKSKSTVYYKDKAAYNQALLEALKDARKKRVEDPTRGFPNAVVALESIILPDEREEINAYKYDTDDHDDLIEKARERADEANDERLRIEILLNEYKKISWPDFRDLCAYLLETHKFLDVSGDGQVDRDDVKIVVYEALLEKIIEVLHNHGWLTFESEYDTAGGGGSALSETKSEDEIQDDLS